MVKESIERFSKIDILVNNAGILLHGNLMTINELELNLMIDTNIKGVVNCVQAIVPSMAARSYGKIVNISSIAGASNIDGKAACF